MGFWPKQIFYGEKEVKNRMGRDFNYINVYKMQSRMNELGMRQKDLAEKSGVSPMCISNVINGHVIPRVNTIVYLAEALEMDVGELITK